MPEKIHVIEFKGRYITEIKSANIFTQRSTCAGEIRSFFLGVLAKLTKFVMKCALRIGIRKHSPAKPQFEISNNRSKTIGYCSNRLITSVYLKKFWYIELISKILLCNQLSLQLPIAPTKVCSETIASKSINENLALKNYETISN